MSKSVKVNAILNGIKQCITLLYGLITIPYISRVLGGDNYGKVNFGASIVQYFTMVAALGVSTYAIREGSRYRNDKKYFQVFANEIYSINILSTILSYSILIMLLFIMPVFQPYRNLILIQAFPILFIALGIDWVNEIYEDYLYTTVRYIIIHLVSLLLLFLIVKTTDDYLFYAGIVAFTNIGANLVNLFYVRKKYIKPQITTKLHFRKHIVPMLILFFNAITITVYVDSDKTILTLMKGDLATGIYSITVSIYTIVKTFINAVLSVSLPRLSSYLGEGREKDYRILLEKMFHGLMILIVPCSAGLIMLSKQIILTVAGNEYIDGTLSLQILALALLFGSLAFFYVYAILIPYKSEKKCLLTTVVSAIANVGLNIIIIPYLSFIGAALTTLISEITVVVMSAFFSRKKYKFKPEFKTTIPCLLGTIIVLAICYTGTQLFENALCLVVSIPFSIVMYCLVLFLLKDDIALSAWKAVNRGIQK